MKSRGALWKLLSLRSSSQEDFKLKDTFEALAVLPAMNSLLPQLMGTSLRVEKNKKSSLASVTEYSCNGLILRGNLKPWLEICSFGEHFVSENLTNATDLVARFERLTADMMNRTSGHGKFVAPAA